MSETSYAVSAKARAKYGKFLTDRDYTNILACQSVPEVMAYLKSHTHFASILRGVNERDVHRGRLEILLRQYQFNEIDSLCRYDSGISAGFSRYVVERTEVEQLVRYLILLNSHATEKFIFQYPAYLSKHTDLDINLIANAQNYEEFLAALVKTQYYDILTAFHPDEKGRLPISEIENRLYTFIYQHMHQLILKRTKGNERQELMDIFRKLNDYSIVSRIIRMKRSFHLPPEVIKSNMTLEYGSLSPKLVGKMCDAETVEEVYAILRTTKYGRYFDQAEDDKVKNIGLTVQYKTSKRYLHFSGNPSVVMLAFIFLSETELMNVISLIEGVRYRLEPKQIESLLIR